MYIYKFTHVSTGRCYIGQTIQNPNQRRLEHIADSKHTTKEYHFHNALRKYGVDSFTFEVISAASTLNEFNLLEEKYIDQFDSINNGFNIRQAGGNKLHSAESKERISIAQKKAHAKRRAEGRDTFKKTRKTAGWAWSNTSKKKHTETMTRLGDNYQGKTWKLIDGKRVWLEKEASV
jgi:group I intron endonuclease